MMVWNAERVKVYNPCLANKTSDYYVTHDNDYYVTHDNLDIVTSYG